MSSAGEARFRVQAPNSLPRAIKVIALDAVGAAATDRLAAGGWQQAAFFHALSSGALRDFFGRTSAVDDEVATAYLIVMVAGPGGQAHAAATIGRACSARRVNTTGLLVSNAADPGLSKTLAQLRPWSLMVVIADSDEYIGDMMTALRA